MLRVLFFAFALLPFVATAQSHVLSGKVLNAKGQPISGASVSLDNTLDGGTTDSSGSFRFSTTESGPQTLVATAIGYADGGMPVTVDGDKSNLSITLKNSPTTLQGVTVTAGAFEAGNDKVKTILTTLDIVTTAGANADVVKAIETLPGTQKQGTEPGLFVRGGDASEAAVIVDGLTAQNAFVSGPPGVATRSRFLPFQFKGVSFSSGGYSARYGQALSSILELNTTDLPDKSNVNLGLNMAGIYAGGNKRWKNASGGITGAYNNLAPFYGLAKTNVDFYFVPRGGSGSANYMWKPNENGILKLLVNGSRFRSGIRVPNPFVAGSTVDYSIQNTYAYGNASYRQQLKSKWGLFVAGAYSWNEDDISWNQVASLNKDYRAQGRAEVKRFLSSKTALLTGVEVQHYSYSQTWDTLSHAFTETITAAYVEADWSPTKRWAFRPGLRYEYSRLNGEHTLAPRLSIAYRTGLYSQAGLAGGIFYQAAEPRYELFGYRPKNQQAIHLIANWQWMTEDRTFRIEGYYKDYQQLVRDYPLVPGYDPNDFRFIYGAVDNSGYGYAQGVELFWRDKKSVKNTDYWVSYSFLDTRRLFRNYPTEATPPFAATHNLNLIGKYWIPKITSQINLTYGYASGRPYYNPLSPDFLSDRTPDYHNLAFTFNYLTSIKKWFTVVYFGVDNLTNHKNIFGYRYAAGGQVRYPQRPALYRSFFVGANFSLTEFSREEL